MSNKVIEVKNLNTYFDDHNVLKNINTDIEKNSVTALIVHQDVVNQHFYVH